MTGRSEGCFSRSLSLLRVGRGRGLPVSSELRIASRRHYCETRKELIKDRVELVVFMMPYSASKMGWTLAICELISTRPACGQCTN